MCEKQLVPHQDTNDVIVLVLEAVSYWNNYFNTGVTSNNGPYIKKHRRDVDSALDYLIVSDVVRYHIMLNMSPALPVVFLANYEMKR